MTIVLTISAVVIYLTTATVVAYAVRAALLANTRTTVQPATALLIGWALGLFWPALLAVGAAVTIWRRFQKL